MNLKAQRAAAIKAAQDIIAKAEAEKRELTDEEMVTVEAKHAEIEDFTKQIDRAEKSASLVSSITSVSEPAPVDAPIEATKGNRPNGVADRFIKSSAFQGFRKSHPSGVGSGTPLHIEAKGLADFDELLGKSNGLSKKELTTETGQFVSQTRLPGYRSELMDEPLAFLDLITTGNTEATYLEYARIISETNNAAIVPEGELKPLSEIVTDVADAKAFTYADGFDVTNQTLADDGALVAFMEGRIRFHVLNKVVDTILNGSGVGTEPAGLMNITGTQAQAFDGDALTTLARSIEKVQKVQATPQAIVLNPVDAWSIRLQKNLSGDFYAGGPFSAAPFTPWGVRVVESNRVAAGTALVGNFSSIQFLQREALSVVAFNQHKDYAQRNKSYVRAELRGMQLFYAPREIVVASLTAPAV